MKPTRHIVSRIAAVSVVLVAHVHLQAAELNVLESTQVDSAGLNFSESAANFSQNINGRTYQRSPISTFRGYQYATYYDGNRNVCLARRKLPSGDWDVIRFTDYTITNHDSHNVVSLGICAGDGTIHLAFDHHKDPLHYRVSAVGVATNPDSVSWSSSLFGDITDRLGSIGRITDLTYPSFIPAPNGNLMFYYRFGGSGSGDGMIHEYDGSSSEWTSGMGKFITRSGTYSGTESTNSTSRNPYINGISYGGNRLHASWGWRENSGGTKYNHDLNYAYSDDHGRTWRNSAAARISTTGSSFIRVDSPGLIVAPIPQNSSLSNQYTHYAYSDGSCHVIVSYRQSESDPVRYHHYWRNSAGTWSDEALPFSGSRPKLVGDDNRELFLAYKSGNLLRVAKGTPNASRSAWSWSTIHSQTGRTEGGEGHIDTSRWESDRILSVYGQVEPPSNGAATALNVFDYQVSSKAILPIPSDGQADVDPPSALEWTKGIEIDSHQVYLGTNRNAVATATPASPEYQGEQSSPSYTPSSPFSKNATYYWRIDEVEGGSTVHPGLIWSFTTTSDYLPGESTDASVKEDSNVTDETHATTLLGTGGSNPWVDRCTVHVFQLPDLGEEPKPFHSAGFRFNYEAKQGSLRDNDLYGLGRRDSPSVLGSDYYGKTAAADPTDATRLQTGILTDATPLGTVETSPQGDEALVNYLNEQYASGAGIGQYVFLRLNTAAPKAGINRATISMAEGSVDPAIRPRISYSSTAGPTVTMVALGTPEDLTDGDTWSDGQPAHAGSHYLIPDTGNLRSESGTSVFPGLSLTVEMGGRFQVRGKEESAELTTVDNLILNGGTSYNSGDFAELAAGTGNLVTNVLDGTIKTSGFSRLLTYGLVGGSNIARNMRLLSRIDGSGRIQAREGSAAGLSSVFVDNASNSFSGTWEVAPGSALAFGNAGGVGTADIEVMNGARLSIMGDWDSAASLSVVDSATTQVDLEGSSWVVAELLFGSSGVPSGTYDATALNALGTHSVFTGSGTITVALTGNDGPVSRWALDEGSGTVASDSSGNGHPGTLLNGANWNSDGTRPSFVSFDGEDDRISTLFSDALSSDDDFTWSWWARQSAEDSAGAVMIGNRFPEQSSGEQYKFIKFTPAEAQFANTDNPATIDKYVYPAIAVGGWHHYSMVKSGTNYQWYVDGQPQGPPRTLAYDEASQIPFNIGGDDDDETPGGREDEHFKGDIDDVVLYERALTQVEITYVGDGVYTELPTTWLESWRLQYFGTAENSGVAADTYDADFDGEINLLEFATNQDPHAATLASTPLALDGELLRFQYTRSKAAMADGMNFTVEWNDNLLPGNWDDSSVNEKILEEDDETQTVEASVPAGSAGRRFIHLRVTP